MSIINCVHLGTRVANPFTGEAPGPCPQCRPAPPLPVVVQLCRECDRPADVRNYGNYCSRSCLRQADL